MQSMHRMSLLYPVSLTLFLVLLSVFVSQIGAVVMATHWDVISREAYTMLTRCGVTFLVIVLLAKINLLGSAGITTPFREWRANWHIALLPVLLVGFINLANVHWAQLQFTLPSVFFWIFDNLSTGVFEEVVLRGLAFSLLYRAWRHSRHGLYKAALLQASIFGVLHLINLINGFQVDVIAQVIYATLLGLSFAGIVAWTGSIWPAAVAHGLINAAANLNRSFVPGYTDTSTAASVYAIFIVVILVFSTLPGLYMLHRANQRLQEKAGDDR